jgi:hypothetical protein
MPSVDYALVQRVQAGDRGASLDLFKKFSRLIKKRSSLTGSPQDFEQSAFEIMINSVNKVDLTRVSNPETWGFYFMLSMDLLKGALRQNKDEYRSCIDRAPFSAESYLGETRSETEVRQRRSGSDLTSQVTSDVFMRYVPQDELFRMKSASIFASFLSGCTPIERRFLVFKSHGIKIIDCAGRLNISYGAAREMLIELRHRAERFVDHEAYVNPEDHLRYKKTHGYRGSIVKEAHV